ncbi:MAG: hypothetical protein JWM34_363 [Ilumatobacteraceae bacterium]|nr:hypothetical protein [Ilumatobacteraceae bacterium]
MRVGFLGAGLIATYHSKSLRRSGAEAECGVVRAGVYDPDPERAAAFAAASGHTVCASEDEVLDGCDAVYVCTWTSEHPRQVAKAISRGLHVFCEKPLATSLAAAEEMATLVMSSAVTNQVGLVMRRSPAYVWAQHLAAEATAGRTMAVMFRDDQFIPIQGHYSSTWRGNKDLVGAGTLLEHSIHDIDMFRFVIGEVTRVSAHQANFHGLDGIEDVVTASLSFANGAIGTLVTVWHDNLARPSLRRAEIFCERRFIHIEGDDWFGPVHWTDSDGAEHTLEGNELVAAAESITDGTLNPDGEFIRAAVAGRPSWPNFATAAAAHRIVEAMYASAREHGSSQPVPAAPLEVVQIASTETIPLRRAVLRRNDPNASARFPEDDLPDTVHLAVRDASGAVVATSSWMPKPCPEVPEARAFQLRGMATASTMQGTGVGGLLLEAGIARFAAEGYELLWARARDSALGFYAKHDCRVVGEGFVDETTQLDHHIVIREVAPPSA